MVDLCDVLPIALDVYPEGYGGRRSDVTPFVHRSGWLVVHEARMEMSFATWRRKLLTCLADDGEVLSPWTTARLFAMPTSLPKDPEIPPPEELEALTDALYWDFLGWADGKNLAALQEAEDQADARIRDIEDRSGAMLRRVEARQRELSRERRDPHTPPERRSAIAAIVDRLDETSAELVAVGRRRSRKIRAETDAMEAEVFDALRHAMGEVECLAVVRWQAKRSSRPAVLRRVPPRCINFDVEAWRHRRISGISGTTLDLAISRDSNGL